MNFDDTDEVMKLQQTVLEGDFEIEKKLMFPGQLNGNILIKSGGVFHLQTPGEVNGNIIDEGGRAEIHGEVFGNIANNGGYLEIFGLVEGIVSGEHEIKLYGLLRKPKPIDDSEEIRC